MKLYIVQQIDTILGVEVIMPVQVFKIKKDAIKAIHEAFEEAKDDWMQIPAIKSLIINHNDEDEIWEISEEGNWNQNHTKIILSETYVFVTEYDMCYDKIKEAREAADLVVTEEHVSELADMLVGDDYAWEEFTNAFEDIAGK